MLGSVGSAVLIAVLVLLYARHRVEVTEVVTAAVSLVQAKGHVR